MTLTFTIPEEIVAAIRLPRDHLDRQLMSEMAYALYHRRMISMGGARRLAGLDKWSFLEGLALREIERHYTDQEMDEDIRYARSSCQ